MGLIYDLFNNKYKVNSDQIVKCVKVVEDLWNEYCRIQNIQDDQLLSVNLIRRGGQTDKFGVRVYFNHDSRIYCLCLDYMISRGDCYSYVSRVDSDYKLVKSEEDDSLVVNTGELYKYLKGYAYNLLKVCNKISILLSDVVINFISDDCQPEANIYFVESGGISVPDYWVLMVRSHYSPKEFKVTSSKVTESPIQNNYAEFLRG